MTHLDVDDGSLNEIILNCEFDEALERLNKYLDKAVISELDQLNYLLLKCRVLVGLGDYDEATNLANQILIRSKEKQQYHLIFDSIIVLSEILHRIGHLDDALKYLQQGNEVLSKIDKSMVQEITEREALYLRQRGAIYHSKGNLKDALSDYQKSLTIREKMSEEIGITTSLNDIGSVNQEMGNFELAIENFERALSISEETGDKINAVFSLFKLVNLLIITDQIDKANQNLQRIKEIHDLRKVRIINQQFRLSEALLIANKKTLAAKTDAQQIFKDICDEEVVDYKLTVFATLRLCDLLIFELQLLGSEEVLNKIQKHLDKLLEIAEAQNSSILLSEFYLLQSKLALIEYDISKAKELLTRASKIADEKGLGRLSLDIAREQTSLIQKINQLESEAKMKIEGLEKAQIAQLDVLLSRIVDSRTSEIERQKEELSDFVHQIADVLKNDIMSIHGYAEFVKIHGPVEGPIDVIIKSADKIQKLLERSVELADAGLIVDSVEEVDLNELVDRVSKEIIPENVVFTHNNLPTVICDPTRIDQVFINLFENALIHGDTTEKITITRIDHENDLDLLISNDGFPIPQDSKGKIFERGYTTSEGRTGLGLAIVRKLVETHGWQISLLPDSDQTTFKIFIPIKLKTDD